MSPLHDLHAAAGAEFQPYGDIPIVSTFGQPEAEYAVIHKSAAIMDWPQRGIIEITGKDRLPFLNNLLTNQLYDKQTKAGLAAHAGVYSLLLNTKGRVVADMNVLELGQRTLLELDARLVEPVRQTLDKHLFSEQVKVAGRVGALHQLFITGPQALERLNAAAGAPIGQLAGLTSAEVILLGQDVIVFRDDVCGVPGYVVICDAPAAQSLWAHFTQPRNPNPEPQYPAPDTRPIGWAAFNAARIEAGRALFGIDFDDSVLPAETGVLFPRAVSLTKGCYLGQEIVARMHARGQLARQIIGIRMEGEALPIAGAKIYDDQDNEIGGITSSTISPVLSNAAICLGLVKKLFFALGTKLRIPAEGAMRDGKVVETPFAK